MNEASTHAAKLAQEHGIDLTNLPGTGNEGLITKADVEMAIGRLGAGHTNIMEAQKAARAAAETPPENPIDQVVVQVALPSQEELMALLAEMRTEIADLRAGQAHIIERDSYERDLTDELFFICKPHGHKWEERRIIDRRTVLCEFTGSAFIGPFEDQDQIEVYLTEKRRKREDSYLDWQNIKVMQGMDARALDRQEKAVREAQFAVEEDAGNTNVLDRRMWATNGWGKASASGVGEVVGPAA